MKTISRYLMTLVALFTMTAGAWANIATIEFTKETVPGSWRNNFTLISPDYLPDFKPATDAEAIAWDGASKTNKTILIYGFDGEKVKSVKFNPAGGYQTRNEISSLYDFYEQVMENDYIVCYTTFGVFLNDTKTEASFDMPNYDLTVDYELVRDMQDEANPVAFSGLPSSGNIVVKKGSDGKYQPAEALTIQLIDPLAAEDAKNIIAADGITIKVLVGAENGQGAIDYDQDNPITLEAFLADMKPGYYWIKAESTDENSPYDGTVYSSEFTVVEKYDLTVKPANDFSKNGLDAVTVGSESVTIDANTGEAAKTGIAPDTEVKVKAKRGYVIDKVEVKKAGPALKTLTVGDVTIYYAEGDSWANAISRDENKDSGLFIREGNRVHHTNYGQLVDSNTEAVLPVTIINANESYRFIK